MISSQCFKVELLKRTEKRRGLKFKSNHDQLNCDDVVNNLKIKVSHLEHSQ